MSDDDLKEIREELREIRELLTTPAPRPDDLVDVHYIRQRTGLKVETIRDGKAGTGDIPRVLLQGKKGSRKRIVRYQRAAVDRWLRNLCEEAAGNMPKPRTLQLLKRIPRRRVG